MKDETFGVPINPFLGLKGNTYTYMNETIMNVKNQKVLIKMLLIINQNMKITKMFCLMQHIWAMQ